MPTKIKMTKKLIAALELVSDSITKIEILVGDKGRAKITTFVGSEIIDENTFRISEGQAQVTVKVPNGSFEELRDGNSTGKVFVGGNTYGQGFFAEQFTSNFYTLKRIA